MNLNQIRKERLRMSQKRLAGLLGYTPQGYALIEKGKNKTPKWMQYALAWLVMYGPKPPFED